MTFEEYLHSTSDKKRLALLKFMESYGDPNDVLKELSAMPPCIQNKKLDVRINHKYFFWHRNKSFLEPEHTALFTMGAIKYCYFGYGDGGVIGLIGNNGAYKEFYLYNNQDSIRAFNEIRTHVYGFENVKPYDQNERTAELKVPAGIHMKAFYVIKNNAVFLVRAVPFIGYQEIVKAPKLEDIIWCQQIYETDSEAGDSNILQLHFLTNKEPCRLFFTSNYAAFQFALELKKRVPHLLYGYNPEYEELYKRNPAALLQIAQNQAHQ